MRTYGWTYGQSHLALTARIITTVYFLAFIYRVIDRCLRLHAVWIQVLYFFMLIF